MTAPLPHPVHAPPRAIGAASVVLGLRDGRTVLRQFRQQGSLKLLYPHGDPFTAVALNTAGGLTGGDQFDLSVTSQPGADVTLTTQAAERGYRALTGSPPAQVNTRLVAGAGALLHWLPQETILYQGAALDRRLTVDLDPEAQFLGVEALILGRAGSASGLSDGPRSRPRPWRRGGAPLLQDALRLQGAAVDRAMDRPALGQGARAMAFLVLAAPDAQDRLSGLRVRLPENAAASVPVPGLITCRVLASDGHTLRRALIPAIEYLAGRSLPKVWRL
jgi:urease accessory protein